MGHVVCGKHRSYRGLFGKLGALAALITLLVQVPVDAQQTYPHAGYPQQPGYPPPGFTQQPGYPQSGGQAPQGQWGFSTMPAALPTMKDVPQGKTAMMDINGFGSPVPAYSFVRPDGWRVDEATVAWSIQPCTGMVPMSRLHLTSPEGAVIQSSGERGWIQGLNQMKKTFQQRGIPVPTAFQNCPDAPATTAANFLQQVLGASRPGMRIVSSRQRPDFVQKAYHDLQLSDSLMPPNQRTMQYNPQIDAAEVVITYDGPMGPTEEIAISGLISAQLNTGQMQVILQFTSGVMSMAAPEGKLDRAAFDRVWQTMEPLQAYAVNSARKTSEIMRMNVSQIQQWQQQAQARIAAHNKRRSSGRLLSSPTGGASYDPSKTNSSILDSSHKSFLNRMGSSDRSQAASIDAIGGTTTVYDPYNGHDVAVQGTGIDIWQTNTGEIFTTDSNTHYDPSSVGVDATQLPPVSSGSSSSNSNTSWIWE